MNATATVDLSALLRRQRASFLKDGPPSPELRIDRMQRMIAMLEQYQQRIIAALDADYGGRSALITRWADIDNPILMLKHAIENLHLWMRPEERPIDSTLGAGRGYVQYQPLGVIGVVSPWNVPFGAGLSGFGNIFAAGNRAMLKMSELVPATAELAREMLASAFDPTEALAVTGDAQVGAQFVSLPFDHILFTGSTAVGKRVMRAAAENLTPVTLELGGKCPVIVGRGADLTSLVPQVMQVKLANGGQICIAPDYVLLPKEQVDAFIELAQSFVRTAFPSIQDSSDYTALISARHFDRVQGSLQEARSRGSRIEALAPATSAGSRKMAPVIVVDPARDTSLDREEIFGPVLPLYGYEKFEDAIAHVNERDRPLALYFFGDDEAERQSVMHETCSGGLTVNGIARHAGNPYLPFGGVGPSGMGRYQAFEGFKAFSNPRIVFEASRS